MNGWLALALVLATTSGTALWEIRRMSRTPISSIRIAVNVAIFPVLAVAYAIVAPMAHPGLYG